MTNRATSDYLLEVQTIDPNGVADALIRACPVSVAASGVDSSRAFVRFRASDDREAQYIARRTKSDGGYRLTTGYGVNQREV